MRQLRRRERRRDAWELVVRQLRRRERGSNSGSRTSCSRRRGRGRTKACGDETSRRRAGERLPLQLAIAVLLQEGSGKEDRDRQRQLGIEMRKRLEPTTSQLSSSSKNYDSFRVGGDIFQLTKLHTNENTSSD